MSSILVLGDGLLGSELVAQTGWDYISRKKDGFDITNPSTFNLLLDTFEGMAQKSKYNTIINCIANTDTYSQDRQTHWDINYKGVANLVDFCNQWGIKLVHISTEFVYANNSFLPTEEDLPQPQTTWYAYTKLLADEYIQLKSQNYLICRELHKSPLILTYPEVWLVHTNGDLVDKIANLIISLINKQAVGIFNVGTEEKLLPQLSPNSTPIPAPPNVPTDTRMSINKLNNFL